MGVLQATASTSVGISTARFASRRNGGLFERGRNGLGRRLGLGAAGGGGRKMMISSSQKC